MRLSGMGYSSAHVDIPSDSLAVFIDCIAGQVDFVVPIDASTALVELHLLKQPRYVAQPLIAGKVHTSDCFMEVSEEVAEMFKEFDRKEAAYRLRTYRHKAYYSLDRDDGLEHEAVFVALSPHELYERKVTMQELHAAIASLPDKQVKRIYAHFILGMTKQDIARAEGVHEKVVRVAIERGLRRLEKILKSSL